jgi:hypothetical protein
MQRFTWNEGIRNGLLIRWSAVRIRPGEPVSAVLVSKTVAKNPQNPSYFWRGLRDRFAALDLCPGNVLYMSRFLGER